MNKNPIQTEATKEAFADALCQLARKKPVAKVSVRDIAVRAGYNRSTFYQYFRDIYDLLEYLACQTVMRIKENAMENIRSQQVEEGFIRAFVQLHIEEARRFDILFQPENLPCFIRCAKQELVPLLAQKFEFPINDPRTSYVLEYQITATISVIGSWIAKGRDMPAEELAAMLRALSQACLSQGRQLLAQDGGPAHGGR